MKYIEKRNGYRLYLDRNGSSIHIFNETMEFVKTVDPFVIARYWCESTN